MNANTGGSRGTVAALKNVAACMEVMDRLRNRGPGRPGLDPREPRALPERPLGFVWRLAADRRHRAIRAYAAPLRHAGRSGDAHAARRADAANRNGELPMIRLAFTIIAGVLLGLIVHLVAVLALPRIATQDAYSRLSPMTKLNAVTQLPAADLLAQPRQPSRGRGGGRADQLAQRRRGARHVWSGGVAARQAARASLPPRAKEEMLGAIAEVERNMRIHEDVLRYLTVRVEELEAGPSAMLQSKGRDREGRGEREGGREGGRVFGGRDRDQ